MFSSIKRKYAHVIETVGINFQRALLRLPKALSSPTVLREQRYAVKASRELLEMYRDLRVEQPTAPPLEIFVQVICKRTGANASDGERMLRQAEESFAVWPVERPLSLRDIVCYLAISESLAVLSKSQGTQADMVEIVHSVIPADL